MHAAKPNSREWYATRMGKLTGSRMKVVMGPKSRWWRLMDLMELEILTGERQEPDIDHVRSIRHGKETEIKGIRAFEMNTGLTVEPCGFIPDPTLPYVGCTPDGLVDGAPFEIKCPINVDYHVKHFFRGCPEEYYPQVQCEIMVCEALFGHFASFSLEAPATMQIACWQVPRNEYYIKRLRARCTEFHQYLLEGKRPGG